MQPSNSPVHCVEVSPPPLVKSGIDHLRALTDIFNATKEGYDDREETQATKTTVHSPRVPRSSPPPKLAKDKNLPDIVPTGTIDDNDKRDTPARNTHSQISCFFIQYFSCQFAKQLKWVFTVCCFL